MRRFLLLAVLLLCLTTVAQATENSIHLIPTGPGNNMQPVPLADGSLVFVTDREENLDLAMRLKDRRVELWETHPADDYAPRLSEGRISFLSDRGKVAGELWQRGFGKQVASYLGGHRPKNPERFRVEYPFDCNADGRIDALDPGWIVDSTTGQPVTPLHLDARGAALDTQGWLWFSLMHQGRRWIARLDAPQQAIEPDSELASWGEWQLLAAAREKRDSYVFVDAIWDADYRVAADALALKREPKGAKAWEPYRWQHVRAMFAEHPEDIHAQALKSARDAQQTGYSAYAERIYTDAAQLLGDAGRGVDALAMLGRVKGGDYLQQASLLRAALLIKAHREHAAMQVLSDMGEGLNHGEKRRLIELADMALEQISGEDDRSAELYRLIRDGGSSILQNHWRLELAGIHLKSRGFEAALSLLEQQNASDAMRTFRMRVLAAYASDLLKNGLPEQAMQMAQKVLRVQADHVAAGRIYFDAAKRGGHFNEASAWWKAEIGRNERSFSGTYLEALRLSYGGHLKQAEDLLQRVVQEKPDLWQARQTLGWVLEGSGDQGQMRRALSLYEEAFGLAVAQGSEATHALRINMANLAFRLKLYDKQLKLMDEWFAGDKAGVPSVLILQAARACYLLSRPDKGLLWLDRLPDTLLHDQASIALRLRALIAAQAEDYDISLRAMNLLVSDPETDDALRVRLLLNKATVSLSGGNTQAAIDDLNDAIRLQQGGGRFGLIRLPGQAIPFDAAWVASSLLAEAYRNEGEWTDVVDHLKVKLKGLKAGRARVIALQNLVVALIRKGNWQQAYKSITQATASDADSRLLLLKVRLQLALGIPSRQQEIRSLLADQTLTDKEKISLRMIELMQQERPAVISVSSQFSDVALLNRQLKAWHRLQADGQLLGTGVEVSLHMGLWMMRNGLDDQGVMQLAKVAEDASLDPWLGWWIRSCVLRAPSRDDLSKLPLLLSRLSLPMPAHIGMVEDIYRRLAEVSLRDDESEQALELLVARELQLARLRQASVASRPLPGASSLTTLRRELRENEAMLLIWRRAFNGGETDLWWMDHDHLLHRHFNTAGVDDVLATIRDWQEGKSRLYWVSLDPLPQLEASLKDMMQGVSIVASPTLIHAARLGRQERKGKQAGDSVDLWADAEMSLMDWRWSLQQGLRHYRAKAWKRALDHLEKALPYLPEQQQSKLLALAGRAALKGGVEARGLKMFRSYSSIRVFEPVRLRLQAGAAERDGDPVLAAELWQRLGEHPQSWKDHVDAATSLSRLALQGVVSGLKAAEILKAARRNIPAGAAQAEYTLRMNLLRLQARFGFGDAKERQREIATLRRSFAGKQESLWQLELLAIESAWKAGMFVSLGERLKRLQQEIPVSHPLQFDLANLNALILHATGKLGDARQAYASAKKSLIHVPAAEVAERQAALHNNLGRLEMDAGEADASLNYFRAALDIDVRRGDRVGELFDRKNLGQLLLKLGRNKEGIAMLLKAEESARALRLPAVEAEATAVLLLVRVHSTIDEALAFRAFVEKHRLNQFDWVAQWLPGEVQRRQGGAVESEASLRRAMAIVEKQGEAAFSSGLLQPLRVYESLIDLVFEQQPEMAHQIAGRGLSWLYGNGKKRKLGNLFDRKGGRLLYFTGEQSTWVWYNSEGQKKSIRLKPGRQALMQRISSLNHAVVLRRPVEKDAKALARLVWSPISEWVKSRQMLDVITVGPLQSLSFAMLHDAKGWLLRQHAFRYPLRGDASAYASLKVQTPWKLYAIAMADPSRPLYLAKDEVEAIPDFIRASSSVHLKADKHSLLAQAGVRANLHIASHVDLVPGYDDFSSILLSNGQRLFEYEVSDTRWRGDWLVLSGCGYDWSPGRALYGNSMSRAFLRHGMKRVVAGLWQVNDLATALLMKHFYRQLGNGASLPVALRQAQLAMQKRFTHPADWAAFRLETL